MAAQSNPTHLGEGSNSALNAQPSPSQQHHQRLLDAEVSEATSRNGGLTTMMMMPPPAGLPVSGSDASVQKPRKNTSFKITNILPSRPPSNDPEEESGEETESTSENVELNPEAGLPAGRMPGPPAAHPSSKPPLPAGSSSSVTSSSRLAAAGRKASLDGNPHQLIRRISQLSHGGHASDKQPPLVFWASCQTSYVPSTAFFLTRNRAYVITALGSSDAAHGPKDRFKVVKITNPEPSQRGRWTGLDFADRQNPMASSSGRLASSRSEAHIDPNGLSGRDGLSTKMPSTSTHHHHHPPSQQPQQQSLPASARHSMGPNGAYGPPQKLVLPPAGSQTPSAQANKLPTPKPQAPTPVFPAPGAARPGQPPTSQPQLMPNTQTQGKNLNGGMPTMPGQSQLQSQPPQQPPPSHPQHIPGQPYVGQVGPPQPQTQQAQQKQPSPYALPTSQYMMVASTGANLTQGGPGIVTTVSSMTSGQDRDLPNHPAKEGNDPNANMPSLPGQAHYASLLPTQHQQLLAAQQKQQQQQQQQQGQSGMFSQPPDHPHLYYNPNHPGAPPPQHHYLPYTPQSASNGQPSRSSAGPQGVPSSGSGQPSVMANVQQQQQQQQQQQLPHQSRSVDHEYGNFVPNHHPGFSHPPRSHLLEQFNGDLLDNDQLVERLEEISSTQPSGTPEEGAEDGESCIHRVGMSTFAGACHLCKVAHFDRLTVTAPSTPTGNRSPSKDQWPNVPRNSIPHVTQSSSSMAAEFGPSVVSAAAGSGAALFASICSASGNSQGAIDNRIEQAMDLVKSHLMNAVRSEVEELKEKIIGLETKIDHLQSENEILKAHAPSDVVQQLPQLAPTPPQMILAPPPAANNANMNNIMAGPSQPVAIQQPQPQQQQQQPQPQAVVSNGMINGHVHPQQINNGPTAQQN
ncbi:trithorax group protein osa-like [Tigriopus californicus]|uniref:trithorax group protein osa-like n=1 Tax=Tigriopus californicus TaxID=6832 RepID=UPI0027D9E4D8|nr:trithorax group protein osa-like [Tigriopus californicus]